MLEWLREIKVAIFDMDGTIFESYLNWREIRKELSIDEGGDILKEIFNGEQVDHHRLEILERYEKENTLKTRPLKGFSQFLSKLVNNKIFSALVTNNNRENTQYLLEKFQIAFDLVITREMKLWKPAPDALLYVMRYCSIHPDQAISLGDSLYDVKASQRAGISNIFIVENSHNRHLFSHEDKDVTLFKDYHHLSDMITAGDNERCRHADIN